MKTFEIAGVPRDEVHRFVRGLHSDPFSVLGPHKVGDDVEIRVFRPNAQRVSVVGDFNAWDGRVNPMRKLVNAGVWELFLPEIKQGAHYKFEIRTQTDAVLLKSCLLY